MKTEQQARKMVEDAGRTWQDFQKWFEGQTGPILEDGSLGYYEDDIEKFINNKSLTD